MPAIAPEIEGALEEGVVIEFLAAPVEVLRNNGAAVGLKCIRMELGEPDASGRPRPVPKPGSEFDLEATSIIAAISQEPEFGPVAELRRGKDWIKTDEWGLTGSGGVYAGGDDVELALVATAIYQGRLAAEAIDAHLRGGNPAKPPALPAAEKVNLDWYKESVRNERQQVPVAQRDMETEIEAGLSEAQALEEAKRCMSCGLCMDCERCWMYCTTNCFDKIPAGPERTPGPCTARASGHVAERYRLRLDACNGCRKCADECPCGYIDLM